MCVRVKRGLGSVFRATERSYLPLYFLVRGTFRIGDIGGGGGAHVRTCVGKKTAFRGSFNYFCTCGPEGQVIKVNGLGTKVFEEGL